MHASALCFAAAAALLAGAAQAQIDFTFYEYNSCLGFGDKNITISQDETIPFDQHIYRAVRTFEHEANKCQFTLTYDLSTAKSINAPASAPMPDGFQCLTASDEKLENLAFESVQVYNCTGDDHAPP